MSALSEGEISLGDKKYFDIFIGERVLKKEVFKSTGRIPVYSANIFVPFGYLEKSNIKDFSNDYLLWGIDGDFGVNPITKGTKFATTDHCGTIKIKNSELLPEYVAYAIDIQGHLLGFDRALRPSLKNMGNVIIKVPLNPNGNFDVGMQKKIAEKHFKIADIKKRLAQEIQSLSAFGVEIPIEKRVKKVMMKEIFNFPETNSRITKEFCQKHRGDIPVYGCSKIEGAVLGYTEDNIPGLHYYQDSLTWNRNGSVGYVFYRKGRFTTNEDHRVLVLKEEYKKLVFLPYIRFVLENEIKKMGFGFTNKLGKSKMEEVAIDVPAGQSDHAEFDYERQKAIADQYRHIHEMKENLISQLADLRHANVEIEAH